MRFNFDIILIIVSRLMMKNLKFSGGCLIWLLLVLVQSGFAQVDPEADKPKASVARGFYDSPVSVELTTETPGASIRYTTDGTTPSSSTGILYSGPIQISTTTPLRATAYASGYTDSLTMTHTYLFLDDVLVQPNDPSGYPSDFAEGDQYAGEYPADYEMDSEVTSRYSSAQLETALKSIPTVSLVTDVENLFDEGTGIYYNPNEQGIAWERPIHLEWIDDLNGSRWNAHAGARIHGQSSRRPHRQPKKNVRVYFRSEYGTKDLDYPLYSPQGEGARPPVEFDRLLFKSGGNRSWTYYDRDQRRNADFISHEWVRRTHLDMGGISPRGTYVHFYLNGIYWGLYDLVERIDEKFYASYMGGDPDFDFEIIVPDDGVPTADTGTVDAYEAMMDIVESSSTVNDALYQQIAALVDLEDLADYMIINHYGGKTDWGDRNWNAYRKTVGPDTRFKFTAWDNDSMLYRSNRDVVDSDAPNSPLRIFHQLTSNNEFLLLLGDRVQKHLFNGGALSEAKGMVRYQELADTIDQAVIGESARWGDYNRDVYTEDINKNRPAYLYSRDLGDGYTDPGGIVQDSQQLNWVEVVNEKITEFFPERPAVFLGQYEGKNWWDPSSAEVPSFSQYGGAVAAGSSVTISNPHSGTIYYTTNGSDPRAFGGAVASGAQSGGNSVSVSINSNNLRIKARIKNGSTWSYLMDYTYTFDVEPVVISEINYSDGPTLDAGDWIEIHNTSSSTLSVAGYSIGDESGAVYSIPGNTSIPANGTLVVARDLVAFNTAHPGVANVVGPALFGLGEQDSITLKSGDGAVVDMVCYMGVNPWPKAANGKGSTLCLPDSSLENDTPGNWAASSILGGTPGVVNAKGPANEPPEIVITSPIHDSAHNAGTSFTFTSLPMDGDGSVASVTYFVDPLDGSGAQPVGTVNSAPFTLTGWSPAPGFYRIGAAVTDNLGAQGAANEVNIQVGESPVVLINEINYKSSSDPVLDSGDWVEIHNPTALPVSLGNWTIIDGNPLNERTQFEKGTIIPAGGFIVLVRDELAFATVHPGVVFYPRDLDFGLGSADSVKLSNPIEVLVDEVNYTSSSPWPSGASGTGKTICLSAPNLDNSVAGNWSASPNTGGTPGAANNKNGANLPPVVSISSPASGASFPCCDPVSISVQASDPENQLVSVALVEGGNIITTLTSAPFQFSWTPGAAGTYSLRAVATDAEGLSTTSPAVSVVITTPPGGNGAFVEAGGQVWMEAESYTELIGRSAHDWIEVTDRAGFSGAGAMYSSPNNGTTITTDVVNSSPEMTYQVNFSSTGSYRFWVRGTGLNGSDNSIWVSINGSAPQAISLDPNGNWTWKSAVVNVATTGVQTVSIYMREDGAWVDKIFLASDGATPSGLGEPESLRDSGNGPGIDIQNVELAVRGSEVCVTYTNQGPITLDDGWMLLMDTDQNVSTGYVAYGKGADFLLRNNNVFAYSGSGSDWSWNFIGQAGVMLNGNQAELCFPQSLLGGAQQIEAVFFGDNTIGGGTGTVSFPSSAGGGDSLTLVLGNQGIVIDGDRSDWPGSYFSGFDIDDVTGTANRIDLRELYIYEEGGTFYLFVVNDEPILLNEGWILFFDTDQSNGTGYGAWDIGADYLLQEDRIYVYSGNGTNWAWQEVGQTSVAVANQNAEFSFPKAWLGNASDFSFLFYGDNRTYSGGSGVDLFPNYGVEAIYTPGGSNAIIQVDGNLSDWSANELFDADGLDQAVGNPIDVLDFYVTNDTDKLYLGFLNQNSTAVDDTWITWVDTDQNGGTGYNAWDLGADYMIRGDVVYEYTGNGSNWSWNAIGTASAAASGNVLEFGVSGSLLGNPGDFNLLFYGNNAVLGGSGPEVIPNGGGVGLPYSTGW